MQRVSYSIEKSFHSLPCFLCALLLLPFACGGLRSGGRVGQIQLIRGDDVVVKPLVELGDDVTPKAQEEEET